VFGPFTPYYEETIREMYDEEGNAIESAPHPQQILRIRFERKPEEGFILRKKK
jgi:putative protease